MARPRQVTDEQILEATRSAVLQRGAQVSLDAVAQQIGVTSPALLKRYGNRQALLLAALRPDEKALDALFLEPIDERPFVDQLTELLDGLSKYFARTMPCVMALRECGFSHEDVVREFKLPMPVLAMAGCKRWLQAMRERGLIESAMIETAATAMVGAVMTRMVSSHLSQTTFTRRSQLAHQRELAALFARALAAPDSTVPKPVSKSVREPARKAPRAPRKSKLVR